MEDNREEAVVRQITRWNQTDWLTCFLWALTGILWIANTACKVLQDHMLETADNRLQGLRNICMIAISCLTCGTYHVSRYMWVHGAGRRETQNLLESMVGMPFSLERYFAGIRKSLIRWEAGFAAAAGLSSVLLYWGWSFLGDSEVLWERNDRLIQFILVCVGETVFGLLCMTAGYGIQKKRYIKQYVEKGGSRKKQTGFWRSFFQKKQTGFWRSFFDGWMWLGILFTFLWVIGNVSVLGERFMVSGAEECYSSVLPQSGFQCIILCLVLNIVQQLKDRAAGKDWDRRKIIAYFLGIFLVTFLCQTVYDRYYDDRIEVARPFQTREYRWEDVRSYKVTKAFFRADIQIELRMGDGRSLTVISPDAILSEQHGRNYGSNFSYVAAIADRLDGMGISGTMEDVEKLEEIAKGEAEWDENAVRAVREIEESAQVAAP